MGESLIMDVLITGGLGFIGLNTTEQLIAQGHKVVLLDNLSPQIHGAIPQIESSVLNSPNVQIIRGDAGDAALLESVLKQVSAVIHLAAETGTGQSMYQIARYNQVNTQGTAVLLDILANKKHSVTKVILASSRSIYGEGAYFCASCEQTKYPKPRTAEALSKLQWEMNCPNCGQAMKPIPTPENAPPQPASIYAATKYAQEDLVRIACDALGIGYTILRFQNVYGAGQSLNNPYTGILSIFSTRIRKGLNLPIFEDGLESRDFVHVFDIARAIQMSLESDRANGQTFNVGSGIQSSILEVAQKLVSTFNQNSEIVVTGQYRLGDIRHCYADLKHIQDALSFTPQILLDEGLNQFTTWVLSQALPEDLSEKANTELRDRKLMY
jgi:dTDP-L-rhamnose 4-epimerase